MNDTQTTESPSDVSRMVRSGPEGTCLETCKQPCGNERRANRSTAPADRGDAIREIATNLERLCIEYACHSRVNGVGNETRAAWTEFKAELERLKAIA